MTVGESVLHSHSKTLPLYRHKRLPILRISNARQWDVSDIVSSDTKATQRSTVLAGSSVAFTSVLEKEMDEIVPTNRPAKLEKSSPSIGVISECLSFLPALNTIPVFDLVRESFCVFRPVHLVTIHTPNFATIQTATFTASLCL